MANKAGRPRWEPTQEILETVETLAAQGFSQALIANYLGINEKTIIARKKDHAQFLEYLERGKAKGIAVATSHLMNNIKRGDTQSIKFYLQHVAKWNDQIDITTGGEPIHAATVNISFED